mgnify:CR=1 FL=1
MPRMRDCLLALLLAGLSAGPLAGKSADASTNARANHAAERVRLLSASPDADAWLLGAWIVTGILTIVGALSYGELAAMMPRSANSTSAASIRCPRVAWRRSAMVISMAAAYPKADTALHLHT